MCVRIIKFRFRNSEIDIFVTRNFLCNQRGASKALGPMLREEGLPNVGCNFGFYRTCCPLLFVSFQTQVWVPTINKRAFVCYICTLSPLLFWVIFRAGGTFWHTKMLWYPISPLRFASVQSFPASRPYRKVESSEFSSFPFSNIFNKHWSKSWGWDLRFPFSSNTPWPLSSSPPPPSWQWQRRGRTSRHFSRRR